jgi:RimJ/RimL family protein N-acetyltransferase
MNILETSRLILCKLSSDDAPFIYDLVNDPDWLRYIGDKNVHNLEDAQNYILNGPMASYQQHGFGLYLTKLKADNIAIGICGLLKRDTLKHVDVGFAFLPAFRGKGYATEAAAAVMQYGRNVLGIERIVAITAPDNDASIRVLEKLGLHYDRMIRLTEDDPESKLFVPD